ncbi:MAG: prenyltransferase/squalene oxidase repeat-containing protein [bacterium]
MDVNHIKRLIKEHVWGPVGSVIVHVVIVTMLVVFAVAPQSQVAPEVEVNMMETKADVLEEVLKTEVKPETPPPEKDVDVDRPDSATTSTMDVPSDAPGSGMGNAEGAGIGSGDPSLAAGFEVAMAKSPLVMRGLYATRTAGGRGGALSAFGGTKRGEDAVMRALRWLKAKQDEDGSWKTVDQAYPDHAPAMAGLALLCFLAHGETPASPEFGQTVERAMKYIVSKQGPNGGFGEKPFSDHGTYEHGICTYAIAEGFGLTKIMALKEAMDKGIQIIINGQQACGGYDYAYKAEPRWDMSVTGWQLQAMKAAKMAGCSNEKLEESITKAIDFLRKINIPGQGGFGYSGNNGAPDSKSTPSMTGAATLCLQLLGKPDCKEVKNGLKWLNDNPVTVEWEKGDGGKHAVYAWYYITQAKFQKGGPDWKAWNTMFSTALIKGQIIEGKLGHWEGGDSGWASGIVYTTTLSCLMLEVYYRYLPTFQHVENAPDAPVAAKSDDVVVEVK